MADPQDALRRLLDEGLDVAEEAPAIMGGPVPVPPETAISQDDTGLLKGILDVLTSISSVGLLDKGAIITKAIGSKL